MEPKTQLTTINFDCQILILEQMEFLELLNIAQTNQYFALLASGVFRRKFNHRTIKIEAMPGSDVVIDSGDEVTIRNFETASTLFKLFGQSITKLNVLYERNQSHADELMHDISEYCSETLRDLSLTGCTDSLCADIRKPFVKVENVSLNGYIEISDIVNLNEAFPNLRQLHLKYIDVTHPSLLDSKFPHLEGISIDFSQSERLHYVAFRHLFEKNPQIRRLSIRYGSHNFIKIVNKYLPNLEMLYIKSIIWNYFTTENGFDNVMRNEHLTDLYFTEDVFDSQFAKLAEAFPNLEKVSVRCETNVRRETIEEFVNKLKKVQKLTLKTLNKKLANSLKMTLKDEWNVEFIHEPQNPIIIHIESKERKHVFK